MNRLAICVATMRPDQNVAGSIERWPGDISTWITHASKVIPVHIRYNTIENNKGIIGSYDWLYRLTDNEILAYAHDDVVMREQNWDQRILAEFDDPTIGVVGFGGAIEHGAKDIYKVPYHHSQLGRRGYLSNVDDAEVHGERFEGAADVAVLDGYALIVRRSLLDRIGGWAWMGQGCDFFAYDYALSCLSHRYGYRVRVVGVRCHHKGGQTSVRFNGGSGITGQDAYDKAHRWIYNEFRDVLPFKCL